MLKAGFLALGLGVSAQWYGYPLSTLGSTLSSSYPLSTLGSTLSSSYPLSTLGSTLSSSYPLTTWTSESPSYLLMTTLGSSSSLATSFPVSSQATNRVPLYTSSYSLPSSAYRPTYSLGSYLPSYSVGSYLPATTRVTSSSVPLYSSTARVTTPLVSSSGSVSVPLYGGTARSVSASVPLYGGIARTVSSTFGTYLPTYTSLGSYGSTVPVYGSASGLANASLFGGFNSPWTPVPAPAVKAAAPAAAKTPEMGMDAGNSMDILGGSMSGGSKVPDSTTLGGSFGSTTISGGSSTSTWDGTSVCVDNTNPDDSILAEFYTFSVPAGAAYPKQGDACPGPCDASTFAEQISLSVSSMNGNACRQWPGSSGFNSQDGGVCNADGSYTWAQFLSCDCGYGGFSPVVTAAGTADGTVPTIKTLYPDMCIVDTAKGASGICGMIVDNTACN